MVNWVDNFSRYAEEMKDLRHSLHQHPELAFEEFETSKIVAKRLSAWGYEVHTGISITGVVGTLRNGESPRTIGLRADMDALPIQENSTGPHASKVAGKMHACGHDGHTSILLGAAQYLAEHRNFSGTLHVIFQPAEEGHAGAKSMIEAGLFEQFPCDQVFSLHNAPGLPVGYFAYKSGPTMASNDRIRISVKGRGGHASAPHRTSDPIAAAAAIIMGLQTVVSRNTDPTDAAVVTVSAFQAGSAFNVIPETAEMKISLRAVSPQVRALINERVRKLVLDQASSFGCTAQMDEIDTSYPPLSNAPAQTYFGRDVAQALFGKERVYEHDRPLMGSEDFAFMLEQVPGAYFFLGNGTEGSFGMPLHSPDYDFNDAALLPGIAFWGRLVEAALPVEPHLEKAAVHASD